MMKETEEMRRARHALQALSASAPAAGANMMRHVAAYALMVTGRRGSDRRRGEPHINAGFVLTHGDQDLCAAVTRRSGTDTLYIAFDVDDAAGPPVATGVISRVGDDMVAFGNCRLWCPPNDGRALLVPQGSSGFGGYLAFVPGSPFKHVEAPLPGDFAAGARRADVRLKRLLESKELRDVHREGCVQTMHSEGDQIIRKTSALSE